MVESDVLELGVEQRREAKLASGRGDDGVALTKVVRMLEDEIGPVREPALCVADHLCRRGQPPLPLVVALGLPREVERRPRGPQQLDRVEHVDGQVAEAPAPGLRRRRQPFEVERPKVVEPGAQQRQRLPRDAGRLRRGRYRQPERGGELRDVENRRGRLADDERRDDRPSRLGPARCAVAPDVERLELDPLLAKELPGRRARRSGRLPEERHSFHSAIIALVKIAVVGAGAMGSVYAGLLGSAGNEVWAVDVWQEHVEAIRERGLRVEGASGDRIVRVQATTDAAEVGEAELVILATKAMDVEAAAET